MINEDFEATEELRYRGTAEGSDAEKAAVGGEKTLTITNHLFQSDTEAQSMADTLLARLKTRKKYFKFNSEFCPVPLEIGDTIQAQERITDLENLSYPYFGDEDHKFGDSSRKFRSSGVIIPHLGIIRNIKLTITPTSQSLTITMEVKNV